MAANTHNRDLGLLPPELHNDAKQAEVNAESCAQRAELLLK